MRTTMSKDEMIEEMSKIIDKSDEKCGNADCFECEYVNTDRCVYILGATELYNAGYRKVAEDEIVIKKIEQKQWLKDCIESNKKTEEIARKETAREILQELKEMFGTNREFIWIGAGVGSIGDRISDKLEQLAKDKGIELE